MDFLLAQVTDLKDAAPAESLGLDSVILGEQFYFFTVVLMWLIHVGFMSYETGISRRKNALATAMKNILTIAVVTPSFYYFGWWIYNCNQNGFPPIGPNSSDFTSVACQGGIPWSDTFGPNLTNNINLIFFLAFLLFSWTTASIMSGALLERVRLSAYLVLAVLLGSVVWILDAAWGWSAGGWMTLRFGFHDSIASAVVHGVAGAFALGVLFNLGPRIGKYTKDGLTRVFRPHNVHLSLMGLMLIFTGFYGFYAACLVIVSTTFPGWANIYLSPTTLGSIAMIITMGFAGGFTGAYFAAKGDPFWTVSGGLAGVISVSAGADVYAPTLGYLIAMMSAVLVVWAGTWIEEKMRVDDAVGAVAVHGVAGFMGIIWVGVFAAGYPTGLNNVESSIWGQLLGLAVFLPLGFLSGYIASKVLKVLNLLRVPPEVELDGLDSAEYRSDIHVPEFESAEDLAIEPDGTRTPAGALQRSEHRELVTLMPAIIDSAPDCISDTIGTEEVRVEDSADFVVGDQWQECAGFMTFGPGSTYGDEGVGAEGAYMVLTWIGIVVMVAVIVAWVLLENRRLLAHAASRRPEPPPVGPQPGMTDAPELDRP